MLSLIFTLFTAYAQEAQGLSGVLLEKGTRKPLKEVNLFLLPHKIKTVSDASGQFVFTAAPAGECQVVVNLTGYIKLEKPVKCDELNKLVLYLEKRTYTNFETTVTGKANRRDDQSYSLSQEEFLKAPGSFGGDPVRAAQNLPGVAQNGGSAQVIVQGASPDDTGYLINGHRVPIVFHFGGLSSVIIPEAVDRVDLLPAGYGPEYSRAIGGVIGLTTKEPKEDRVHGMAFIDLLNTGGLIEGPIDEKSSFLMSGRYSYIGQVLKAVAQENENSELTAAPTFYDLTGIYKRKLNDKNIFRTTFVASRDQLELISNNAIDNDPKLRGRFYSRTEFFRIIPQVTTEISAQTKLDNSVAIGRDAILFDIGGRFLDVNSNNLSQRSELSHEWSSRSKTYVGLDNYWSQGDVGLNLPNSFSVGGVDNPFSVGENRKFNDRFNEAYYGAYLRQELKPTADSAWTFLPNLRIDHFTVNQETWVQPRLQLRYQYSPSLQIRSSLGQYVQEPQPQESSRLYGNPNIRSPYAWHYTLGFSKDFRQGATQGFEILNNYFFKDLKDLVVPAVSGNYSNQGSGIIYGSEVQAKYKKDKWSSQLVYTYLKSERSIPGFGTSPSEFDQTHNLNLIGAYNLDRWTISARFRFVTGNPYTPVTGATFDADNDVFIPVRGQIYSQRFNAFNQLDIRIDRRYVYDTWILTAYVDIQNFYNAENSSNIEYSYDYKENKKVRGLPILPTVGLKGEF